MKTTSLTLEVDSEKLSALRQYAAKKGVDTEQELQYSFERLYEKCVPAAVRDFLSEREAPTSPPRPPRPSRPGPPSNQGGG